MLWLDDVSPPVVKVNSNPKYVIIRFESESYLQKKLEKMFPFLESSQENGTKY